MKFSRTLSVVPSGVGFLKIEIKWFYNWSQSPLRINPPAHKKVKINKYKECLNTSEFIYLRMFFLINRRSKFIRAVSPKLYKSTT